MKTFKYHSIDINIAAESSSEIPLLPVK